MKNALQLVAISFLKLVSLLPFWFLYRLSDLLFLVLYYLTGYRREVIRTNLANAFPEKSTQERKQVEKNFYRFLADIIVETIKMNSISAEEIKKRCRLNNLEEITKYFDKDQPILMATGHYGNWEWGNLVMPQYLNQKIVIIFKPLSNKVFGDYMNKMRARFGTIMVPMKATLRKVAELKNDLFLFGFTSDQTPTRHESQYFTPFLNQQTAVFLGMEKIARKTNHPVLFLHINRYRRGYYEFTFSTLVEKPSTTAEHEITDIHTQKLEQIIRQKPELWLWSHRRWKFTPEELNR